MRQAPAGEEAIETIAGKRDRPHVGRAEVLVNDERETDVLAGGGEMGALMRSIDWSTTVLGPVETWPRSLCTVLGILLSQQHPMFVWWGRDLVQFYNDGYRPILAAKHPAAMGQHGRACWGEIWPVISPMIETVFQGGSTYTRDGLLCLDRNGFLEECYFNYAYGPIRDETGNVAGVFVACSESTGHILGERRLRVLGELGAKAAEAKDAKEACETAARVLSGAASDVPFALIYLLDENGRAVRAGIGGLADDATAAPLAIATDGDDRARWPIAALVRTGGSIAVEDVESRFGNLPGGPWPESAKKALILSLVHPGSGRVRGFLVAGISPRLALDDPYERFLEIVARHVTSAITNAEAFEAERGRAEALAEIDRAKTAFFSNISHEFRTPLTLILGPTEDLLAGEQGVLAERQRDAIGSVHRNALRLLRLVNTLLDFARIEAGRVEAVYEPTDLAALTGELASVFRAAVERAGLSLRVECEPLAEPVYVDRDMWEKIVLNLVSNALKFTFEGEIVVAIRPTEDDVVLEVRDTGTGMPEEALANVFQRFHRVEGARGRTHEGSGIGLALVHDLVSLHRGRVSVESALGVGSTFTVSIPKGTPHLAHGRVGDPKPPTASEGAAFVEEALGWSPSVAEAVEARSPQRVDATTERARSTVLVADDNADLRAYVTGLLSPHYDVEVVADGQLALEAARRRRPDLILSDVMMPRLDGRGLLRELRSHDSTRTIPVILLSARAGEEATVEGLEAGADDYLQKPFSARELLARVRTHLEMVRIRRVSAEHERIEGELREAMNMRDTFLSVASHELRTPLTTLGLQLDGLLRMLKASREPTGPALLQKAAKVRGQANRLEQLIEGMLDVFTLTGGRLELHLEETDLGTVARAVVERFRHDTKRAAAQLNLRAESVPGTWDRAKVDQILSHLVENALKFGGEEPIDVVVDGSASEARILVRDRGIGVAREDQARIFERFERAVPAAHYGGFGLGLWIVRGMAEAMGGSVRAESQPGAGAAFEVTLPRKR